MFTFALILFFMKRFFAALLFFAVACNNNDNSNTTAEDNNNPAPPLINYQVVKIYPHDTSSYTQGLEWYNNFLYEGTGDYEHSKLLKTDINTGEAVQKIKVSDNPKIFGEGITILNNKIYQLTWQNNKAFVYDLETFKKLQEFDWPYEGWGLTNDGKSLIVSTGTSNLYYVNPDNFKIEKTIGVTDNYGPVSDLNELEYVKGVVYANIYQRNIIVKINPETGKVEGRIDLSNIQEKNNVSYSNSENVLNGIAYDSAKNVFYVTGKLWPAVFEIRLNP